MFIADVGGGAMSAAIGILAGLVGRARTGEGAFIDISMHHASLYWLMLPAARLLVKDVPPGARDLPTDGTFASYNVYECADGKWLALGALEEKFWGGFCARIGKPEWTPFQYDAAQQPRIIADTRALMRTRTRDEWVAEFASDDICVSPINNPAEALAAAQALVHDQVIAPPWRTRF
jgi:crotonobetainyl-CoA:carnitine CoA-transferase CaiB-like acyl-CoA transferase